MTFKILRLQLQNWKSFPDVTWDFKDGLNLLLGHNYSGKTSCIQALYYALTGHIATPVKAKPSQKDLAEIRKGVISAGATGATVTLDLALTNETQFPRTIRISRSISKAGKDSAHLYEVLASGESETSLPLDQLIGFSEETLEQFLFLKEGEIFETLYKAQGNFQQFLEATFGLAHYRDTLALVKQLQSTYEKQRKDLSSKIKKPPAGIPTGDPAKLTTEKADLITAVVTLQNDLGGVKKQVSDKEGEIAGLRAQVDAQNKVATLAETYRTRINNFQKEIAAKRLVIHGITAKYPELGSSTLADYLGAQKDRIKAELLPIEQAISRERTRLSDLSADTRRFQGDYDHIAALPDTCPTCLQGITESHKTQVLTDIKTKITANQETQRQCLSNIQKMDQKYTEKNKLLDALDKDLDLLSTSEQAIEETDLLVANCENDLDSLSIEDSASLETRVGDLDLELGKLKQKLKTLEGQISENNIEIARIDITLGFLQQNTAQMEQESAKLFDWTHNLEVLIAAIGATIEEFRNRQLQALKRSIELYWQEFCSEEGILEWDAAGLPMITCSGHPRDFRNFSESERCVVLLATKLSILSIILHLPVIVVDEPFHHFSPDRAPYVASILRKFRDMARQDPASAPWQIICTTFNPAIQTAVDWDQVLTLSN